MLLRQLGAAFDIREEKRDHASFRSVLTLRVIGQRIPPEILSLWLGAVTDPPDTAQTTRLPPDTARTRPCQPILSRHADRGVAVVACVHLVRMARANVHIPDALHHIMTKDSIK